MVTTKSFASMDEDGLESEAVLQRLNIILKARPVRRCEQVYGHATEPTVIVVAGALVSLLIVCRWS